MAEAKVVQAELPQHFAILLNRARHEGFSIDMAVPNPSDGLRLCERGCVIHIGGEFPVGLFPRLRSFQEQSKVRS